MNNEAVSIDPGVMHGIPCFAGTRVPVKHLFEFIEGGETMDEFLRQFPSVDRRQATSVLNAEGMYAESRYSAGNIASHQHPK